MGNIVSSIVSIVSDVLGVGDNASPQQIARSAMDGGTQKMASADGSTQGVGSRKAYAGAERSRRQQSAVGAGDQASMATQGGDELQMSNDLGGGMRERSLRRATTGSSNLLGE